MKIKNIPIIFIEGPIARSYIAVLLDFNIKETPIIYLNKSYNSKFYERILYNQQNHYPIKFLKDKNFEQFINDIEKFFSHDKGFINRIFNRINIYEFNNFHRINSNSINSQASKNIINNFSSLHFLNTGKEILKDVFETNKKFYHIHPGYLPKVRGADGSLNSIYFHNEIGCTFFEMTRKIDEGDIFERIKFNFKKFKIKNFNNYNLKDIYRVWYSFFDIALRSYLYKRMIQRNLSISDASKIITNNQEESNYYSFLKEEGLKEVFKKIFYE